MNKKNTPIFFIILIVLFGFSFGFYGGVYESWAEKRNFSNKSNNSEIKIGGDFELIDKDGKTFKLSKNLEKEYALIFFGYSKCPTICPKILTNIFDGIQKNPKLFKKFQIIFISLDPKTDSPSQLKEFSENFDNKILMLTSTKENNNEIIKNIANNYKVYYARDEKTKEINHTSIIYIVNKKGEYQGHVSADTTKEFIKNIQEFLK